MIVFEIRLENGKSKFFDNIEDFNRQRLFLALANTPHRVFGRVQKAVI